MKTKKRKRYQTRLTPAQIERIERKRRQLMGEEEPLPDVRLPEVDPDDELPESSAWHGRNIDR